MIKTLAYGATRMDRAISGAPSTADQLLRCQWPGNVRELANSAAALYRNMKKHGYVACSSNGKIKSR